MWEVNMIGLIIVMAMMEVVVVTSTTISKVAMSNGLSSFVYTTYTHGIAFFFLIPFAFLFHRKKPVPPIGVEMIFRLFLLGCTFGTCSMLLSIGIRYSSPTLASAMNNLCPAITFLLGILFRMEILNIRANSSVLKLMGTLVSITGAFIVTFYQGWPILLFPPSSPTESVLVSILRGTDEPNWVLGGLFLFSSSMFLSLSFVIKTWIVRDFPSEILITLISFFFETILAALVTFIVEDDASVWTPSVSIMWMSLLFGAFDVGVVTTATTWACGRKGPLFVAMFKPLQMVIAVIMGVSFLGDVLHVGSVIGGTIIGVGFYTVMKGKADEEMVKLTDESSFLSRSSTEEDTLSPQKMPLLQNKSMDV